MIARTRKLRFTQQEVHRRPRMPYASEGGRIRLMTHTQLRNIESFFRRSKRPEPRASGRRGALLILGVALLSRVASGQVPTVTALPYVLTEQAGVIRVITTYSPVKPVPPAVGVSQFGSLLGGGFSSILTPSASAVTVGSIALVHKLAYVNREAAAVKQVQQWEFDTNKAMTEAKDKTVNCNNSAPLSFKGGLQGAMSANRRFVAEFCAFPEEEEAQQAEEELEALNEAGEASQEAIEAAEEAAEVAEAAAEAAEASAEAALDAVDVLEALLETLSLF
jgi:hypothetical protein